MTRQKGTLLLFAAILGWVALNCVSIQGFGDPATPRSTPDLSVPRTQSPTALMTASDLAPAAVMSYPTAVPNTGVIIPTVQTIPDWSLEKLKLFLGQDTILMDAMGITAIDPRTGATLKLEQDSAAQFYISSAMNPLSPDRKWIAYNVRGPQLVLIETSTAERRTLFFPGLIQNYAWLSDSRHLLLNVAANNEVGVTDPPQILLDWLFYFDIETNSYEILQDDFHTQVEDITPDGKSYVYLNKYFSEDATQPVDLMLGSLSGGPPVNLTDDGLIEFWADITPDGEWLAVFASDPSIPYDPSKSFPCSRDLDKAYLLNMKTVERREYSIHGKSVVGYPVLSPDGKKIAFTHAEGISCAVNFPIYVLDTETGANERLEISGESLGWSPDGSKLVIIQESPDIEYRYMRLVIYDLASREITAKFYIEDVNKESALPYWIDLNR